MDKSSSWIVIVAGVVGWEVVEVKLREEEAVVTKLELEGRQVWWKGR